MSDLEGRISRLEAQSDIRQLKARYLNACDAKDMVAIRACFTPDAEIDFPPLGKFDLDGLMGIFEQIAATTPIIDVHHGHNGEIAVDGETATGRWNLGFATYDPRDQTFRMLASFYEDCYRKTPDGWLISYTKSTPRAVVDGTLASGAIVANWTPQT